VTARQLKIFLGIVEIKLLKGLLLPNQRCHSTEGINTVGSVSTARLAPQSAKACIKSPKFSRRLRPALPSYLDIHHLRSAGDILLSHGQLGSGSYKQKSEECQLNTSCMAAVLLPVISRHMMMCSNNMTWNAASSGWLSSTADRPTANYQPKTCHCLKGKSRQK